MTTTLSGLWFSMGSSLIANSLRSPFTAVILFPIRKLVDKSQLPNKGNEKWTPDIAAS